MTARALAWADYENVGPDGKNTPGKRWWLVRRELADGRVLYLYPLGSGVSLGVSSSASDCGYGLVFDFMDQPMEGMRAALCWDGQDEPEGWNRASKMGFLQRRRPGGGGPETEYVDPHELAESGYTEQASPWLPYRRRR